MLLYPLVKATGKRVGGRTEFEVMEDFALSVPLGDSPHTFKIPRGTKTDFASVPRALWSVLSPIDPHILVAALIHDQMYKGTGGVISYLSTGKANGRTTSRFMADAWLREIMNHYGAPLWKRTAAFYAVRSGGAKAFVDPTELVILK